MARTARHTIEIGDEEKAVIDAVAALTGLSRRAITARVIRWLGEQDHDTLAIIVNWLPDHRRSLLARAILEQAAEAEPDRGIGPKVTQPGQSANRKGR